MTSETKVPHFDTDTDTDDDDDKAVPDAKCVTKGEAFVAAEKQIAAMKPGSGDYIRADLYLHIKDQDDPLRDILSVDIHGMGYIDGCTLHDTFGEQVPAFKIDAFLCWFVQYQADCKAGKKQLYDRYAFPYVPSTSWAVLAKRLTERKHIADTSVLDSVIHFDVVDDFARDAEKLSVAQVLAMAFYYARLPANHMNHELACEWLRKSGLASRMSSAAMLKFASHVGSELTTRDAFAVPALAEALHSLRSVTSIRMSGWARYDEGLISGIASFLTRSDSVRCVHLRASPGAHDRFDAKMAPMLAKALAETKSPIDSLNLVDTRIGDEAVMLILKAIDGNPHIKRVTNLNLAVCELCKQSTIDFITDRLKTKFSITGLNLALNPVVDGRL